ncbi:MAG: type II toxin-antitoxin system PemK/MazF family toxin [bacterium]|nr:type II toxin-antitoxin system PemK/MazF family toxin [bacterium]
MQKDFDGWNEQKKEIDARKDILLYHERDIRWCRLGTNVGFEQDGTGAGRARPVLVLKAFNRHVCLVVPLTTSTKQNPYYVSIGPVNGHPASVIISQLRLIDTKRLTVKITRLNKVKFDGIRKTIKAML